MFCSDIEFHDGLHLFHPLFIRARDREVPWVYGVSRLLKVGTSPSGANKFAAILEVRKKLLPLGVVLTLSDESTIEHTLELSELAFR